jgi:hypothetical protein
MLLLCALSGYWLLVSPLIPYQFNTQTVVGMALFLVAHQLFTVVFGSVGIVLNGMTVRDERITRETFRRRLRRQ